MKRHVPTLLMALAVLLPGATTAQSNGAVSGTVWGRFDNEIRALPFSVVEAWGPGFRRSVVTDSLGQYRIERLPPGALRLRASYAGHTPVTVDVLVPREGDVLVDLELNASPVELPPVEVTTDVRVPEPDPRAVTEESEALGRVDAAALEIGTGFADAGLADAMRAFGGNDPAQASDVLFMRGSTTDLKLVLLDGAPVYTPFHVAGLLKSFEPAVLGRADLHVGGAPARYDGGLTYILDLRTKRPRRDSAQVSGSLDLIAGSVALDAPLGDRAGIVASARSLHSLGEAPLGASPYGYRDVLVSLEGEPSGNHLLRATGFWNREAVVLDLLGASGVTVPSPPDEAWWSNHAVSAAYYGRVGGVLLESTLAASGYQATLPLQPSAPLDEPTPAPILAHAQTDRIRGGVEVARPSSDGTLRAGVSFEALDATYSAEALGTGSEPANSRGRSTTVGAYVDGTRSLGSSVAVRLGLRADRFSGAGTPRLAPRASLTWSVAPDALVTVATGRYHQHARATDVALERSLSEVVADTGLASDLLPVASADHVVVSLDQTLGDDVRLGVAGFWKSYSGLRSTQTEPIRSSGVDLRVQRRGETATAWLGYGLSWYWAGTDLSGSSTDFTGRQLLTAGLFGSLGSSLGADVRVAFGAGLPYTSVPFSRAESDLALGPAEGVLEQTPPLPGGLDENFLRVDLELYAVLRPHWGGRTWQIRPYLRVLNALDRRDALFYAFEPWRSDELTPLAERALVPVVGVAWRF